MSHGIALRLVRTLGGTLLASALLASAGARTGRAEQFVLVDYTIDYTKAMADKDASHFFVRNATGLNPARPSNWMAPVNYRNGTVHVRTEVLQKPPGGETTQWTLCYMPNRPTGPGYGCTGSGTYKEQGAVVIRQESMTSWWQNTGIVWTEGIKEMHFVIKDSDGASGHAHKRADAAKFFPTKVRITMVQVSAGAQFDASQVPGWGVGATDGGAADGRATDASASDTGAGTGGTPGGGTGGSSGSGGSSGGPAGSGGSSANPGSGGAGTPPGGGSGGSAAGRGGSGGGNNPTAGGSDSSGSAGCSLGPARAQASGAIGLLALALCLLGLRRRRRS
jgi:hypothetical protein